MTDEARVLPPYPRATMRIQLSGEFTFDDAAGIVADLARLGVSHLYASPVLTARSGSTHGYDIVDHHRLNPEFGGEDAFFRLVDTLQRHGMGLILDFVPNHMGVGYSDNAWWLNVLEWGEQSPYASFFDIDWHPSEHTLRGKILIPVLGQPYGDVLESGELVPAVDPRDGTFSVYYYEHRFPVSPRHYDVFLNAAAESFITSRDDRGEIVQDGPADSAAHRADALRDLARRFSSLRSGRSARAQAMAIRTAGELQASLAALMAEHREVRVAVEEACSHLAGTVGTPSSFDRLHRLLERQAYRPAYWRLASNEINYRRFFDINDLAALRMERTDVFDITHQLLLRLVGDGAVQGLRLDHIDGLLDPKEYLRRLQEAAAYRVLEGSGPAFHPARASLDQPLYVVVEKILAHHEELRPDWATSGTTGYDHMALVNEVLTDPEGEQPLTATYERFIDEHRDLERITIDAKHRTMQETLASELNVLANRMSRLAKRHRLTRDLSRLALRRALAEIVAHFPVYRSYVDAQGLSEEDRRDIEWAVARARGKAKTVDTTAYDFIQAILTTDLLARYPGQFRRKEVVELAMKVQQFTAPVMAKSVEDTAYYRDVRFVARNEVGSEPDRFFTSVQGFHYACRHRRTHHPFAMVTTATHDHKRGEDVRARLAVLSEISDRWAEWCERMAEYGAVFTTERDAGPAPSRRDQYMILQTIVGTWPFDLVAPEYRGIAAFRRRIADYALKAAREAKLETSWTRRDSAYEDALTRFIDAVLTPERSTTMMRVLMEMVERVELPGVVNSLSQKLLTLTVPGVPDIYQGTDGWDLSLVDPDNRRPVDWARRRLWLDHTEQVGPDENAATRRDRVLSQWRDGEIKHLVVRRALGLRRDRPDLFAAGEYEPLTVNGPRKDHIIAFARVLDDEVAVVVVPRLVAEALSSESHPLPARAFWRDTEVILPVRGGGCADTRFSDMFGENVVRPQTRNGSCVFRIQDLLADFPVALLWKRPSTARDGEEVP